MEISEILAKGDIWAKCYEQVFRAGELWACAQKNPPPPVPNFELFNNFSSITDFVPHLRPRVHHSSLLVEIDNGKH